MKNPLSNNLNAIGELVDRYGFEMIALTLSRLALDGHITQQGWEAADWREIHDKMEAICKSYPTEHCRKIFTDSIDNDNGTSTVKNEEIVMKFIEATKDLDLALLKAFLVNRAQIKDGQELHHLSPASARRAIDNIDAFKRSVIAFKA